MRRKLGLGCLTIVGLFVVALFALAAINAREASLRDRPLYESRLNEEDKAELAEARYLQSALGDDVWPGLGRASIPIILFNDRYEFLIGMDQPPVPWVVVEGDDFLGQTYYRRETDKPQAFSVVVGSQQAGSIGTLERMNREYLLGVRRQLPPVLAQLFPYQWATLSRDLHTVSIMHEVFHAYQSSNAPARFAQAQSVYTLEKRYPYKDAAFATAWNREGMLLASALKAKEDEAARGIVQEFLQARSARRAQANLAEQLIVFERELEWLEGQAKYVEMRFYELAASKSNDPQLARYQPGLPYWQMELSMLEGQLGQQQGDFRFYLSGMAEARLLDRLMPGWQSKALGDNVHLESLLQAALRLPAG